MKLRGTVFERMPSRGEREPEHGRGCALDSGSPRGSRPGVCPVHPISRLPAPPGRSPLGPLLGAGCPRRALTPQLRLQPRPAETKAGRAQEVKTNSLGEWGKKKNQVTPLHAELRKRKGRRDKLIGSPTPLGAEPRAVLSLPQVRGTAPDEHPTCWMPATSPC